MQRRTPVALGLPGTEDEQHLRPVQREQRGRRAPAGTECLEGLHVLADPARDLATGQGGVPEVHHRVVPVPLECRHHQVAVVGALAEGVGHARETRTCSRNRQSEAAATSATASSSCRCTTFHSAILAPIDLRRAQLVGPRLPVHRGPGCSNPTVLRHVADDVGRRRSRSRRSSLGEHSPRRSAKQLRRPPDARAALFQAPKTVDGLLRDQIERSRTGVAGVDAISAIVQLRASPGQEVVDVQSWACRSAGGLHAASRPKRARRSCWASPVSSRRSAMAPPPR